jgi:hypothetical protein
MVLHLWVIVRDLPEASELSVPLELTVPGNLSQLGSLP